MKKVFLFLLLSFSTLLLYSNNLKLSPYAEISLLTCDAGNELYSAYGHSALRVKDPIQAIDVVFNYGTFDFQTDYFLAKFIRGTLDYSLSTSPYDWFIKSYENSQRSVVEQVLNLSAEEKQAVFNRLIINYETDERLYRYDFFYDNCSSRIHEILREVLSPQLSYGKNIDQYSDETFRDLIAPYLRQNVWAKFGVGIIMGYPTDNLATYRQKMFLPLQMKAKFNQSTIADKPLVKNEIEVFKAQTLEIENPFYTSPYFVFWGIFVIVFLVSVYHFLKQKHFYAIDYTLFFITGIAGVFFLLMWFGTRHSPTYQNMNMFWAMPLNLIALFFLKKPNIKPYLLAMFCLNLFGFWVLPQVFHPAIIPIALLMAVRYLKNYVYLK